ncbi:hypothetical protein ABFS82_06G097900 [Erythranthe guttata]|uniref:THH1/TOM1/TOM3 domain-containing protein n=1 Tax=Erythranthe guttata TaxID=4155 RepID=A0A022PZL4_ERYGU|nr:PREDICTED: uncharacterized protein LOC105977474 [Erythranthe guttata]EYU19680.1 hypothetical protein MIMGU_mgv1a009157mg [Erythranthe guttata]|eukprot:XP_012858233.1 PREDICTED: uncharacterized protein LOC105977474 [Erythranthe guttata]
MRKLLSHHHHNVLSSSSSFLLPPSPSPSPSQFPIVPDYTTHEIFFFSSIPIAKSGFDLATLATIAALLLLSLISFSVVIYTRLRSRRLRHLENFNSLWTVRLLLVTITSIWAVNEILRLPLVRRKYLYPFLPTLNLHQQSNICKIHVVLSLGFLEPSFLVTLLFLVNVSIKKSNPSRMWALVSLLAVCAPVTLLQLFFVYSSPLEGRLPRFMHGSSVAGSDYFGSRTALCTYPFFSSVVFGGFAAAYAVAFLCSCWRVMDLVINKGIRNRIYLLAAAVMVALSVQIACLSLSWLWMPEEAAYGYVVLAMFLFVAGSMAVGEVILVIKPIAEALSAAAELQRRPAEERTTSL